MNTLRVTTLQTHLHWENPEANRAMLEEKISRHDVASDVIILPEMFTTGFTMNAPAMAEPMNLHTTKWLKAMAEKTQALIMGSAIIKEGDKFFNRLIWAQPDGVIKTYDKRHLFRMAAEEKVFTAGHTQLIAEWKGWKICPLICYDLRFPVWSRNRSGAFGLSYDLLIYVANWPAPRSHHWKVLLQARAIENLCYVVGVNRVGQDGKGVLYDGHTSVIDPQGKILYQRESDEEIITHSLSPEALQTWREKFPAWKDGDGFEILN